MGYFDEQEVCNIDAIRRGREGHLTAGVCCATDPASFRTQPSTVSARSPVAPLCDDEMHSAVFADEDLGD